jgi:hypothetical protein
MMPSFGQRPAAVNGESRRGDPDRSGDDAAVAVRCAASGGRPAALSEYLGLAGCDGDLALYATADGGISFKPQTGVGRAAFVLSIPKAGTYLAAAILETLGLIDLEVHLWKSAFSDYRWRSLDEKVGQARLWTVEQPIEVSASLIRDGQFAVGHLKFDKRTKAAFDRFARVVMVREMRDALVSMMRFESRRFLADAQRSGDRRWLAVDPPAERMLTFLEGWGFYWMQVASGVAGWIDDRDTMVLAFESLMGDGGAELQENEIKRLAWHLGVAPRPAREVLGATLGSMTQTYSGSRTDYRRFWDASVEAKFRELGGHDLNRKLGYE